MQRGSQANHGGTASTPHITRRMGSSILPFLPSQPSQAVLSRQDYHIRIHLRQEEPIPLCRRMRRLHAGDG